MKRHRTDGVSLSFGVIFLAVVLWWAVARVVDVRLPALGWLVAGGLIVFGVAGLLGAIRSGRRAEVPGSAGDTPPGLHADIVRELLENPADRLPVEPVTAPPVHADAPPVDADPAVQTRRAD